MKRGLGAKVPDPQGDPLDAIVPAAEAPTSGRKPRKPGKPRKSRKRPPAAPPVKLSIRLSAESHATLLRLAAFTPDSMSAIVQAAVIAETRRRVRAYETEYGHPLPDLP